jgi:hypothetical protein
LLTLLAAASLMLCVVLCALWVRSHWVYAQYDTYRRTSSVVERRGNGLVARHTWQHATAASGGMQLRVMSSEEPAWPAATPRPWFTHAEWANAAAMQYPVTSNTPLGLKANFHRAGVQLVVADYNGPDQLARTVNYRELSVTTPFWLLVLLSLIPPALWLAARRRRQRLAIAAGMCPQCGYDLRASPDRCPECGTQISTVTA